MFALDYLKNSMKIQHQKKKEIYEIKELINYSNEIQAPSSVTGIDLIQQKINLFQSLFK